MSCKGVELGHILLLNINRKPYIGSPIIPFDLTLSGDFKRSKSRPLRFQILLSHNEGSLAISYKH